MKLNLNEIRKYINTPSYVFDFDSFKSRCKMIKTIVGDNIDLCYSMKANPFLIEDLPEYIRRIEVCSPGELSICEHYLIPANYIFYSGVNKNIRDIEEAYRYGVREFTVESYKHLELLNSLGESKRIKINVHIRISSETQFGMDINDIKDIIHKRKRYSYINIRGLHYFSGTQKKKSDTIIQEIEYIYKTIIDIKKDYDFSINYVEYGTGLFIDYFNEHDEGYSELINITPALQNLAENVHLTIEMGRFFAAKCGYYFTKIDDIKRNDEENFIIVDGGIHQLVYDGQLKAMRKPKILHLKHEENTQPHQIPQVYTICGSLCTTNDVIVRDYELNLPELGDTLVFGNTGAYTFMEGMSTFLSRELPQIWAIKEDKLELIRDFIYTSQFNQRN